MPAITIDPAGNPSYPSSPPVNEPSPTSSPSASQSRSTESSCNSTKTVTDVTYFVQRTVNLAGSTGTTTVSRAAVTTHGCSVEPTTVITTLSQSSASFPPLPSADVDNIVDVMAQGLKADAYQVALTSFSGIWASGMTTIPTGSGTTSKTTSNASAPFCLPL